MAALGPGPGAAGAGPGAAGPGAAGAGPGAGAANPFDRAIGALARLTSRSNARNARFQIIQERLNLLNLLVVRIEQLIPRGGVPGAAAAALPNMQQLIDRVNALINSSNASDAQQENIMRQIDPLVANLTALHRTLRPPAGAGPPNPQDQAIDQAAQRLAERVRNIPAAIRADDDEMRVNGGLYTRGAINQLGGYKHSKTNSRKYMVKKFRTARHSLQRKKRRRSKTLRRKPRRKL